MVNLNLNHTHDCDLCSYLGSFASWKKGGMIDCYFCDGTLIMRFGSDGPDYICFPVDVARLCVSESADWKRVVDLYDAFVMEASG